MKLHRLLIIVPLLLAGSYLVGCCGGGTKEKVVVEKEVAPKGATVPTLGQQLEDLKQAYENGTITEKQYEEAKKKLLEQQ